MIEQRDNTIVDASQYFREDNMGCVKIWNTIERMLQVYIMPSVQNIG